MQQWQIEDGGGENVTDRDLLPQDLPNSRDWAAIVAALRALLPDIQGVVLYGSRVSGRAEETSDYDVLCVVHDPAAMRRRAPLDRQLRETGLRVDLNLATPRGLELHMLLSPYVQYCLATGVRIGLPWLPVMPVSRQGLADSLIEIELDLEDSQGQTPEALEGETLRRIAKQIAVLEQAMADIYDASVYTERARALTSGPAVEVLESLVQVAERLSEQIGELPPNSSDARLRERLRYEAEHPGEDYDPSIRGRGPAPGRGGHQWDDGAIPAVVNG